MLRHKGLRLALILALGALPFTHLAWTLQALIGLGLIALLILLSRPVTRRQDALDGGPDGDLPKLKPPEGQDLRGTDREGGTD